MTDTARSAKVDPDSLMTEPSETGRFGEFGGRFVPETLVPACQELEAGFRTAWADPQFRTELDTILRDYAGRPSMLTECFRLSEQLGVRVFLKREDLNHTGSHKINNVLGQALLAKRMGKTRLVAETGAGQHGVASATAAALMRDWVATVGHTHYCLGSVMGPHPYPWMVRQFHRVIGDEARQQCRAATGADPDLVVACVGGGSNAIGIFSGFVDTETRLVGVEPAGGAAVRHGVPGVVHGMRSYLMQDEHGQVEEALSISAGLDYPGVGPEHSYLASIGRAEYPNVTDAEVVEAFQLLARTEGIIPALESAHAIAWLAREAPTLQGRTVVVNLSGRGDKDVSQMMDILG